MAAGLAVTDVASGGTPAGAFSFLPVREVRLAAPAPAPAPAATNRPGPPPEALAALRQCETGGNYGSATGNGYYGAYQFSPETWRALGYVGLPHQAPPAVQDEAAGKLWAVAGWRPWPGCSAKLRLR
jgi:hypothetical protein